MKKLMILGGSRYILPVIEKAHEYGMYVITCDYLPDNIAHKFSDEYCNASVIDREQVLECARRLSIDGIMSFACDPGVVTAAYVAEKMGLPSCGSYESVSILQNKGRFRSFLEKNGFNVPKAKSYTSLEEALIDISNFTLPVMVKPVDSAGSKGVSRVESDDGLKEAISSALEKSISKEFIIEEFIEQAGYASDCDSFSVGGEIVCWNMDDQMFDKEADNPYTPAGYLFPCSMDSDTQQALRDDIQRLLRLLGMKTSLYNIETRVDRAGRAFIMECSPRAGGNRLAEMVRYYNSVDMIDMAVRAAVGMGITTALTADPKGFLCEVILHADKSGKYMGINIDDSIADNVIETDIWPMIGEQIHCFSGANDAIGTLVLRFNDKKRAYKVMNNIRNLVNITIFEGDESE